MNNNDILKDLVVKIIEYPDRKDWVKVKKRALVTIGKEAINPPSEKWKYDILKARHSPIRYLRFSVYFENLPSYIATHLARHSHAQPFIKSQRNDRQSDYDRNTAPQAAPVNMIWDLNAEELMIVANKRLCHKADTYTTKVIQIMCDKIIGFCPEFKDFLVPMCFYLNGCKEMFSCGLYDKINKENKELQVLKPFMVENKNLENPNQLVYLSSVYDENNNSKNERSMCEVD